MTNRLPLFSQIEKNDPGIAEFDDLPNLISLSRNGQDITRMPLPMTINEHENLLQ